jgi:hypothetical protein
MLVTLSTRTPDRDMLDRFSPSGAPVCLTTFPSDFDRTLLKDAEKASTGTVAYLNMDTFYSLVTHKIKKGEMRMKT